LHLPQPRRFGGGGRRRVREGRRGRRGRRLPADGLGRVEGELRRGGGEGVVPPAVAAVVEQFDKGDGPARLAPGPERAVLVRAGGVAVGQQRAGDEVDVLAVRPG